MWTPEYITIPQHARQMLSADIESEKQAIRQYQMHMKAIQDSGVNALLSRIILDEEYHIMILHTLLDEVK
jgi:bacterioferritin